MLQPMIRGQIVRNQATIDFKCMQAPLRTQTTKPSRDESCMPDGQCCVSYAFDELDAVLQSRKKANPSCDINELR